MSPSHTRYKAKEPQALPIPLMTLLQWLNMLGFETDLLVNPLVFHNYVKSNYKVNLFSYYTSSGPTCMTEPETIIIMLFLLFLLDIHSLHMKRAYVSLISMHLKF